MSLVTPEPVEKLRKALHVKAKEEVEFDVARRTGGGRGTLSSAPLVVAPVTQDGRAGDAPHPRRVLGLATGAGEPVGEDGRPSVCEGMILERAGCGKSARPVRRAAAGDGVGINRVVPAHHRASRRLYPMRRMMPERRRNGRRMFGEFVTLRSQPVGWRAKGRKKGNSGGAKGHWGVGLGTAKVAGQVQPLARCQWRRKVGEPSVASTTQWHGLEVVQDLSEQCGARPGLGEGQLDAAHADAHPHADLEQLVANRAALRLGQPRSGESDAT